MRKLRTLLVAVLLVAAVPAIAPSNAFAATQAAAAPAPETAAAQAEAGDAVHPQKAAEQSDEKDEYRLAWFARFVANTLHISVPAAATLLEVVNFAILAGAILWVGKKKLPVMFRGRSEALKKQLVEARAATEDAQKRLLSIEQRLATMGDEITAMRAQAERDALHEEENFRETLQRERERIVNSAEEEIVRAGNAAQRELKLFAADLAVSTAEKRVHVTPELDQKLLDEFLESLGDRT